ncbi:DUF1800 domain-containing protein [Rhodanobacter sp. B2A1Ga4]|uniref:DUF1800 domain-containing protein n=1 Tax=Rhodanobacter sp. B2A1Ga4 TaxID=2778647 RepID=UPI001B374385|nr:DUF1800 domain-containing protein [Rhodanobacter sp. B2A1Ga4]MBQ4853270.1 DUF1800 domain-containing protein [Rhodanobacter sp. B2A1Ga4]
MPAAAPLRHRTLVLGLLLTLAPALACAGEGNPPDQLPAARVTAKVDGLRLGDIAWLRRDSFGLDSATLARYRELGRTRFLDQQLAGGDDSLPPQVAAQIDHLSVISTPLPQQLAEYQERAQQFRQVPAGPAKDAAKKAFQQYRRDIYQQAAQAEMLHAIYGGDQLKEQLVWFWLNHFSVYADKGPVRLFAADYEENVIRPHALGKFRDLVMATLQSPAMLVFLDNVHNVQGKTNENYARELMELHTLGVNAGYSQQDVQQLMRILTGVGLMPAKPAARRRLFARSRPGLVRDGLFVFNPNQHDFGDKNFLGQTIKGRGYAEVAQAVDLITRQPACAHFISQQLAEYFIADQPPAALVDAMAKTFQRTDGDIAAVMRTMLLSPEAAATDGHKFKDPMRFLVSSMRLVYDGQPIPNAVPLVNWLRQMDEPLYGRITPDGWPLDSASWTGSGQMSKRFDFAGVIGSGRNRLFVDNDDPAQPGNPSNLPREAPALQDSALYRDAVAPGLSIATGHALSQARSPTEWNTFLLSSPDFNYR